MIEIFILINCKNYKIQYLFYFSKILYEFFLHLSFNFRTIFHWYISLFGKISLNKEIKNGISSATNLD